MTVGVYSHGNLGAFIYLAENLRDIRRADGLKIPLVERDFCLCSSELEGVKLEEDIILHPGDNSRCFDAVSQVVVGHPKSRFYVLAQGRPKRKEGIGRHQNVLYVGVGCDIDFRYVMDELNRKYLGFTLTELRNKFLLK